MSDGPSAILSLNRLWKRVHRCLKMGADADETVTSMKRVIAKDCQTGIERILTPLSRIFGDDAQFGHSVHYRFPRIWSTKGETVREALAIDSADPSWAWTRTCWQNLRHGLPAVPDECPPCGGYRWFAVALCAGRSDGVHDRSRRTPRFFEEQSRWPRGPTSFIANWAQLA